MTNLEAQEINNLPVKYQPLGMWSYFGYSILFAIPFVGFIFLLAFSFSSSNVNRRNFARSYFCVFIILLVVVGISAAIMSAMGLWSTIFNW